jgi:glycosyltransferase involved in cell wall biosynthesis
MNLKDIQACILIPTFNNQNTLKRVIEGVLSYSGGADVIVINDGSTDQTATMIGEFGDRIRVLHNEVNRGKGFSLRRGFKEAIALGYKNAISIDSDGQHLPADIPLFIKAALLNPGALIMGSRNMKQEGVPGKSSFGNKFSNFWFKFETGLTLPDTQTGFRLYPLEPLSKIKLVTTKFETEIEVIVKLAWRNVRIIPIDIQVIYDSKERVTHFRPFQDFTRISILNTYFVILTLLYHLPKRLFLYVKKKGLWKIIKEEALKPDESNFSKARSIAFGFFMGILPIWGFQLLVGIPIAVYFRMNKVLFLAAANVSLPPMIPLIIFLSYRFGGLFYQNGVRFDSLKDLSLDSVHENFIQYFIGGSLLALCAGLFSFGISWIFLKQMRKETANEPVFKS